MKQIFKCISLGLLLGAVGLTNAADVRIRSQSVDTARELSGWTNHVNLFDMGCMYGSFAITPEYTQSFNGRQIARSLFGSAINNNAMTTSNNNCNKNGASFRVSGSQSPNRLAGDLLADYFGLPLDYQSTVYVKPEIQNFLVDFDFFLGLDDYMCGLWFRVHAPVVYAKWKLRMNEVQAQAGTIGYPAGYFSPAAVPVSSLNTSFVSYLGGAVPTLNGGVTFEPLQNAMVPNGTLNSTTSANGTCSKSCKKGSHTTQLSDIRMALGRNFWQDEDYHVGLGILLAAPTGNCVNDRLLFQPMVGNGHHWELGFKFTSHYIFWTGCDDDRSWGFYLDMDLTHLFAAKQFRVFDLVARGDNSKYMLAEQLTTTVTDHLEGNPAPAPAGTFPVGPVGGYFAANYQFNNIFTPVANIAAQNMKVSQDIQIDLTAMFSYEHCGLTWDIGYNFWFTSCEKFKQCGGQNMLFQNNNSYALKGDASVYAFDPANAYDPVALSASNNNASICSGSNYPVGTLTPFPSLNAGIDSAEYAYGDAVTPFTANNALVNVTAGATVANQTRTSIQPILLANNDIDPVSIRSKGLSNKIFSHISYTWEDCECYIPYLGMGGKAEFAGKRDLCNIAPCTNSSGLAAVNADSTPSSFEYGSNKAFRTNISEWGIWIKGGFSFN